LVNWGGDCRVSISDKLIYFFDFDLLEQDGEDVAGS
jgi:hypothetical protein